MNNVLPEEIGQYREDPITWSYFIHKVCKGSWHVPELVSAAEWYLLSQLNPGPTGQLWDVIKQQDVAPLLLPTCPWIRVESYIQDLLAVAGLAEGVVPDSSAIHSEEYYNNLWERRMQVPLGAMIVDSWPVIQRSWSAAGYDGLEVERNALHAMAAMVRLAASIKRTEVRRV